VDLEKLIVGNAAGTARSLFEVDKLCNSAVTRITVGSVTTEARDGNAGTTYHFDPATLNSINSIGLKNIGIDKYRRGPLAAMVRAAHDAEGRKLHVSVAGFKVHEFSEMAEICFDAGVDGVELNLGCPNIHDDGVSKEIFSYNPELCEEIFDTMKIFAGQGKEIGAKISPVPNEVLRPLAQAINRSTVITEVVPINTLPGQRMMLPDGKDALTYLPPGVSKEFKHEGGLAGAALREHGLRVVKGLRELLHQNTRIIGVGGIFTGAHAGEYLDSGADGFMCATSFIEYGVGIFTDILRELPQLADA
jgi:dihydroorotate dehydrogenase